MSDRSIPEYRALLTVDIEDYSSRTDAEQRVLQSALVTALDRAADAAELNREQWVKQVAGDGLMALLPPGADVCHLLDVLVRWLDAELGSYNRLRELPTWSRIRMRLAVHAGPIHVDGETGWPGRHAVLPARLRDSEPIRAALAARPEADLAVIVSSEVYNDYVTQGPGNPRPSEFRPVRVEVKKQKYVGYLHLPRFGIHEIGELAHYDVEDQGGSGGTAVAAPVPGPRPSAPGPVITAGRDVIGKARYDVSGGGDMSINGGSAQ
jgi:class 3 adenylate cyclase